MVEFEMNMPLQEAFEPTDEYMIRPFVELKANKGAYKWTKDTRGNWRTFLAAYNKRFTKENSGKLCERKP